MELHILLILCISTMSGMVFGQEDFFFKVGQGFEQGRQISGWGNRNQWLQQVRGSKRPPSLKELEKWWNSPPKPSENLNMGDSGNNNNGEEPDIPFEDNNGGFVPMNFNFGPQSGDVMSPAKDPLPPFTKDAALRIKDYAALLKNASPHKWKRGKGKRHRHHRQHMKKFVRKHKRPKHSPNNPCWSPMAYECNMHQENISPIPNLPSYDEREVQTNYDVVGRQPIGRLPGRDFFPSAENWDSERENQKGLNNHQENWENQNGFNNYRENWEAERENHHQLMNQHVNWEAGRENHNQLINQHENWEAGRENQNELNNHQENWDAEKENQDQLNNHPENWDTEIENHDELNNHQENWEAEKENHNQVNNPTENWKPIRGHHNNFKHHRQNWKAIRGHHNSFKNHRQNWKAVRGRQNSFKNHRENWKAVRGQQNHVNNYHDYRQNEDWENWVPKVKTRQNYRAPIAHTSPHSMRGAHYQNNNFRNSYKYSNWRALQNRPNSWKNHENSENYNLKPQKARGELKSTWIAPVYSWHDQPNEMSLMTKELATLYNGGHRHNTNNNGNRHLGRTRKHRLSQHSIHNSPASTESTSNNRHLSPHWNSPSFDRWSQIDKSWSNGIQSLISEARSSVF